MEATRVLLVTVGMSLVFALAACGQRAEPAASGQPPAGTATLPAPPSEGSTEVTPTEPKKPPPYPTGVLPPPGDPTVLTGAVLLPASQVDASGMPASFSDHNVYEIQVYSLNGGRTLQITASANDACTKLQARVADQTQDAVRVNISPLATPQGGPADGTGGGGMCAQVLTPQTLTVDLKVPLGTRKVILTEAP
jgi:hypothetical protein